MTMKGGKKAGTTPLKNHREEDALGKLGCKSNPPVYQEKRRGGGGEGGPNR